MLWSLVVAEVAAWGLAVAVGALGATVPASVGNRLVGALLLNPH